MSDPKITVAYYSSTGTIHAMASAVVEGAEKAGAEVRLRKAAESVSEDIIRGVPGWHEHAEATSDVPELAHADLEWADGYLFGTPTRYGNVAAQMRQFLDTLNPLFMEGKLANKPASGFTAASSVHGGQETTLISLYQTFMHWGAFIVPPGYTDEAVFAAGGNPYGASSTAEGGVPSETVLAASRHQGKRVAETARTLALGRAHAV